MVERGSVGGVGARAAAAVLLRLKKIKRGVSEFLPHTGSFDSGIKG